jgi:hypothetical protein
MNKKTLQDEMRKRIISLQKKVDKLETVNKRMNESTAELIEENCTLYDRISKLEFLLSMIKDR